MGFSATTRYTYLGLHEEEDSDNVVKIRRWKNEEAGEVYLLATVSSFYETNVVRYRLEEENGRSRWRYDETVGHEWVGEGSDVPAGYCVQCGVDVVSLLSETTETMHPRDVNFCPTCGATLVER